MTALARADGGGASGGLTVTAMIPHADAGGSTMAYIGEGADVDATSTVAITADGVYSATATTVAVAVGGLAGGVGADATADVSGIVDAHIGPAAGEIPSGVATRVNTHGAAITITARSSMTAIAQADGAGVSGGVTVAVMLPNADVMGITRAYVGEGVEIDAGSLTITANAPAMLARASSFAVGIGGFGAGQGIESEAVVSGTVEAYIGANAADVATMSAPDIDVGTGAVIVGADALMRALAEASGLGLAGLLAIGVMLPMAKVTGRTRAYIRDGVNVDAGSLTVQAGTLDDPGTPGDETDRVRYEAVATAKVVQVSIGGAGAGANAEASVDGTVEAFIGAPAGRTRGGLIGAVLDISGPVRVGALSDIDATATADGTGAAAGVSVTVMVPTAHASAVTRAYAGDGSNLKATTLTVRADGDAASTATTVAVAVSGLGAGTGATPTAITGSIVEAFVGERADTTRVTQADVQVRTTAGGRGTIDLDAVSRATALAEAKGAAISGIAVNVIIPSAKLTGRTSAYIGPRTNVYAGAVTVDADELIAKATAKAMGGTVGLGAVTDMTSLAVASRATEAFVGHHASLDLGGSAIALRADATMGEPVAFASNQGGSAGLVSIAVFKADAIVGDDMRGAVTVSIANPAVFTLGGHGLVVGDMVRLTTTGSLPTGLSAGATYYVVSATSSTFQLSSTPRGPPIATSGTQSGTHTLYRVGRSLTRAFVGDAASVTAGRLDILATSTTEAKSEISFLGIAAFVGVQIGRTTATAAHDTEAFVGDDAILNLSGALVISATRRRPRRRTSTR